MAPQTSGVTTVEKFDILMLSEEARNVVSDALSNESQSDALALWVEVTGTRGAGYTYDLFFSDLVDAPDDAAIGVDGGITIVIPASSVERLAGVVSNSRAKVRAARLGESKYSDTRGDESGRAPRILALGVEGALGLLATSVLEQSINPSIASHGGRADLVAMDEEKGIVTSRCLVAAKVAP